MGPFTGLAMEEVNADGTLTPQHLWSAGCVPGPGGYLGVPNLWSNEALNISRCLREGHPRPECPSTGLLTGRFNCSSGWAPGQGRVSVAGSSWGSCPGVWMAIFPLCAYPCPSVPFDEDTVFLDQGHPSDLISGGFSL